MIREHRLPAWVGSAMAALLATRAAAAEPPAGGGAETSSSAKAPATAGSAATTDQEGADKGKPSAAAGGYSWNDKPRKRVRRAAALPRHDAAAPVVTFPGFRLRPDGTSLVWVTLSRKSAAEMGVRGRIVTFRLRGVYVDVRNNTNPLVTSHFTTPVQRVWLRPEPDGASLVIELRESLRPSHRLVDGPRGTMVLEVTVPPGTRTANRRVETGSPLTLNSGLPPAQTSRRRARAR